MDAEQDTTKDLWQEHSLTFLEMAFRTDRQKRPANPSGIGRNVGSCRDTVTMFVVIKDGIVHEIAYELDGCLNTNACANTVAEIVQGHHLEAAWKLTPEMVSEYLQTLPGDHFHCAELAVGAFYRALRDYQQNGAKEWMAGYRRRD